MYLKEPNTNLRFKNQFYLIFFFILMLLMRPFPFYKRPSKTLINLYPYHQGKQNLKTNRSLFKNKYYLPLWFILIVSLVS